jgi:hypothetical protein
MPRYYVVTPQYDSVVPILDDGSGPTESGCDVIEVEAPTKRAAVIEGVKRMLKGNPREYKWCRAARSDGYNPFAGVRAIPIESDKSGNRD